MKKATNLEMLTLGFGLWSFLTGAAVLFGMGGWLLAVGFLLLWSVNDCYKSRNSNPPPEDAHE